MIDLDILRERGITDESLRQRLSIDPAMLTTGTPQYTEPLTDEQKAARLLHRIRSRIQEGMDRNFRDYRVYYALDKVWETPFNQISPTLVHSFLGSDPNQEEVYKAIADWGLTSLISESPDPKTGKPIKTFNYPVFFNVMVPLVRAYVTIRWAKIMNDRNIHPLLKYEPIKRTTPLSLKCEALTDRVQVMASQMGYYDVLKQSVLKMLLYGNCYQFIKEEWFSEEQYKSADELDVALERAKPDQLGTSIKVTAKEGLRYHTPHPTRVFRDLSHPAYSYNHDNGCEFAGYWRITRWREILNGNFWNKDKVSLGSADLVAGNRLFFTSVYASGLINMPTRIAPKTPEGPAVAAEVGLGAGALDRERELANQYYGTDHGDQGVLVTEYFERLIPSENGMGNYDCPVWFRFLVAGDSGTVLYAAPLPYCPIVYYGYDEDASRSQNPGLGLEVLPFQDHFSNILTQIILTAKQNLANLTLVDTDQLEQPAIDKLQNMGETTYRFLNIFGFSPKKVSKMLAQGRLPNPVYSTSLPKGNVAELQAVLRQILEVLERVLVMSSQEVAQAASHELRADEVRNIAQSTSTRLMFTATPVDIATDAWKRQIYQGLMAYGDPHIYTQIPSDTPLTIEQLQAMGFTFLDPGARSQGPKDRYLSAWTTKDKTAMDLWQFASTRHDIDRTDDGKMAVALSQVVQTLMNNPMTAQAIGPAQAIELTNVICRLAGLPRDLKLRDTTPQVSPEEAAAAERQKLEQLIQVVLQQVEGVVKPLVEENKAQQGSIDAILKMLNITPLLKSE